MPQQSRGNAYGRSKKEKCEEPTCLRQILSRVKRLNQLAALITDAATIEQRLGNMSNCLSPRDLFGAAKEGNCKGLPSQVLRSRSACTLFKKCMPKDFRTRNLTVDEISNIGVILFNCGGDRDIAGLPKALACDPRVAEVRDRARDSPAKANSDRRCRDKDQKVSAAEFKKRGAKSSVKLGREAWNATDLSTLIEVLSDIKDAVKDISKKGQKKIAGTLRTIAKKGLEQAKKDGNFKKLADSYALMTYISKKDFEGMIKGKDILAAFNLGDDDADVSGLTDAQRKIVIAQYMATKKLSDMTEEKIREVKDLAKGFSSGEITKLEPDDKKLLARILGKLKNWSCKKGRKIWKLLKDGLKNVNDSNPLAALSEPDVDAMDASVLSGVEPDDLEEASTSVSLAICTKLGKSFRFVRCKGRKYRKKLAKACRKRLNKEASNAQIDQGDLSTLGGLAVLDADTLKRAAAADILAACPVLRGTCPSKEALEAILAKLMEALKGKEIDASIALSCGSLLPAGSATSAASQIAIANNPDPELSSSGGDGSSGDDSEEDDRTTTCERDATEADKAATKAQEQAYSGVVVDGVTEGSKSERRRRAASTAYTCADITAMGPAASAISADDVKAMTSNEILNCLTALGSVEFSDSLRTVVADKIKAAIGNVCSLTSDQISGLGPLAYSLLTPDIIKCLDIKTDEAVSGISYLPSWSSAQLTALAKRFRETRGNLAPSALTSDHLTVLSHLTCGLTLDEIKQIPAAQFSAVSSVLGKLSKAPTHCLQGMAHLAKQAYGAANTWKSSTYSDLGIVVAGLSGDELKTATESAIESWSRTAISSMSATQLEKIEEDKLESFGSDQAAAVSDETRMKLSVKKQNALLKAKDGDDAVLVKDGASNAIMKQSSLFGMAVTLLIAYLL